MSKLKLDIQRMREMYLEEKMTYKEIGESFGCVGSTVSKHLRLSGVETRKNKYSCNEDYFEQVDSHEKAYWLGFIYADGFITGKNIFSIKLAVRDRDHLQSLLDCLDSNHPINDYTNKHGFSTSKFSQIVIHSYKMIGDLEKKGVVRNKTLILSFPSVDQVPKEYIWSFILGYFDGDGSVYHRCNKTRNSINLVGTLPFLTMVNKYIQGNIYKENRTENIYYIVASKTELVSHVYMNMYEHSSCYLQRKKIKFICYSD